MSEIIKTYQDFPKKGISFKDLNPLYEQPIMLNRLLNRLFSEHFEVDYVLGIDSRGFILGATLAQRLNKGFIPIRKKGKLAGNCFQESYYLEYGEDTLEIQDNQNLKGKNVLIVDDIYATGGTMNASMRLAKKAGVNNIIPLVLFDIGIAERPENMYVCIGGTECLE